MFLLSFIEKFLFCNYAVSTTSTTGNCMHFLLPGMYALLGNKFTLKNRCGKVEFTDWLGGPLTVFLCKFIAILLTPLSHSIYHR